MNCRRLMAALLFTLLLLSACDVDIDAPRTPTIAVLPTQDKTAVARLATKTPTLTYTPSLTVTLTSTPTATNTRTPTQTFTASPTRTAVPTLTRTLTATATMTYINTPTLIPTRTVTPTPRPTQTAVPTLTRTPEPTITSTPSPSVTPTEPIAQPAVPSATPCATHTFTPFPSLTPNQTATWEKELITGLTPTPTPGGIYTLAPTATPPPTITPLPGLTAAPVPETSTFYDPNALSADQETLPVAVAGDSGPALPEQQHIVVSYVGQVVPLLNMSAVAAGSPSSMAQGDIFAMSSSGQVAAIGYDRTLYIDGQIVIVSPASRFGLHANLSYGDLVWSPDGQRLAMRVDAADPAAFNSIDSGIWIYEPATNRSWQVFRNIFQAAQLHEQRRAVAVQWAPNGTVLAVVVDTPLGRANVFTPVEHNANQFIEALPYANMTWAPDSASVIVSGYQWGEMTVVGRVALDSNWTYTEYMSQQTSGLVTQHAIELFDGRIAFLGGPTPDSFALHIMPSSPGVQPVRVSPMIPGQIVSAEWKPDRTAVLVTAQVGGVLRLWIIRVDGIVQDATPAAGVPISAHWR